MRTQSLVDSVTIPGNYSLTKGAIASLAVVNFPDKTELSNEEVETAADELASFLLQVVPASILSLALEKVDADVYQLEELGDEFDQVAFDKITENVDPGLNAFLVDKIKAFGGGIHATATLLNFTRKALSYALNGHVEAA